MSDSSEAKSNQQKNRFWLVVPNRLVLFFDISSLTLWAYAVLELLFVDFGQLIAGYLPPSLAWVSGLSVVPFLALVALFSIILRSRIIPYLLYVVAFPLIIVIWKVPALLWAIGSWNLGILVLNTAIGSVSDLRYKLISSTLYVTSLLLIVVSSDVFLVSAGVVVIVGCMFVTYVRAAINSFRTPRAFAFYRKIFGMVAKAPASDEQEKQFGPRGIRVIDMPEANIAAYRDNLQTRLLISTGSRFFAERLQDFQRSQIAIGTGILSAASLLIWTFVVFSFAFMGVYKVAPQSIGGVVNPGLFQFSLMSFSNMLFGTLSAAAMVDWQSLVLSMIERFLSISVVGIFLTLLFNVRTKKYDQELQETIEAMKQSGADTEQSVVSYYGYKNAEDALADLVQLQSAFANFLVRLSGSIRTR